jgi:hypothetical protein
VTSSDSGLIHYFRGANNQWTKISDGEYESRKDELPEISFATRYPIDWNQNSCKHHLDEIMDNMPELQFANEELKVHQISKTTSLQTSPEILSSEPLYFSNSSISKRSQKVIVSYEKVRAGNQTWDLNPLIFYRVKKPIENLD